MIRVNPSPGDGRERVHWKKRIYILSKNDDDCADKMIGDNGPKRKKYMDLYLCEDFWSRMSSELSLKGDEKRWEKFQRTRTVTLP